MSRLSCTSIRPTVIWVGRSRWISTSWSFAISCYSDVPACRISVTPVRHEPVGSEDGCEAGLLPHEDLAASHMRSKNHCGGEAHEDGNLGDLGIARDQPDAWAGHCHGIQRVIAAEGGRTAALLGAFDRSRLAGACGP